MRSPFLHTLPALCRTAPRVAAALVAFGAMLPAAPALAASLGTLAATAGADISQFGTFLVIGAAIIGVVFFILGLMDLAKASNQPGSPKGGAFTKLVVGALLLGLAYIIGAVSGTFGGGAATTGLGRIGIAG